MALPQLFDIDFELSDARSELIKKIRWIIRLRFVISPAVVLLMLFTGYKGLTQQPALTRSALFATLITAGIAVALNLVYAVALRRGWRELRGFVVLQLALDVLLFTSYVYRSGGVTSPFSFLYLLPIIAGAMLVSGAAAGGLALMCSACFGTIAVLEGMGSIEHISYFVALDSFARKWSFVVLMMIVNPFAFFTVAALSAFLMRAVRTKTDELTGATLALDRRAQLLELLYNVSRSAADERGGGAVLERIGNLLVEGLELDRALVYVVRDAAGDGPRSLVLAREFYHPRLGGARASERQLSIPLEADAGLTARCALDLRPINVTDPSTHPEINRALAEQIGLNPFALAPMAFRGRLLGVLGVDRSVGRGVIDDDAFKVLIAFAGQAAVALRTAELEHEELVVAPG